MKQFIGIIPARYASTRFPGKPLAMLLGKPMIQWVYEGARSVLEQVVVATDDRRIKDAVDAFGGQAVMTSCAHRSGTERCAEACRILRNEGRANFNHVINIQGDEPQVDPTQLKDLMACFTNDETEIATLVHPIREAKALHNPNRVKVVTDSRMRALYFSRAAIPFQREAPEDQWHKQNGYYQHIGIYAYEAMVLEKLVHLPPCRLEENESLEQLRWLFHGYQIQTSPNEHLSMGVDTPEDLEAVKKALMEDRSSLQTG